MQKKKISIVIPCYRSSQTVTYVVERIQETVREHQEFDYEIILVNDGSPDETFDVIAEAAEKWDNIIAVDLSRNFGQHSALLAGYSVVSGDYVLGMDDDGEHDPKDMFKLVEKLEEGYDYVCAKFPSTDHSLYKRLGSKLNNWMATKFVGKPADAIFSSYYIMRRYIVDHIVTSPNPRPYIGGMIVAVTKRLSYVEIEHHTRRAGKSSYNLKKSIALWVNGITAYSVKPLRLATAVGGGFSVIGLIWTITLVVRKLLNPDMAAGYTSLMSMMLILGGINITLIGLVGEYIGRVYIMENRIPPFIIRNVVKSADKTTPKEEPEEDAK